jgi:hypothetical protein
LSDGNAIVEQSTKAINKGRIMEELNVKDSAVYWAGQMLSVAEDVAEGFATHWLEINTESSWTEEELTLKFMPMALEVLKKHAEFTNDRLWEF